MFNHLRVPRDEQIEAWFIEPQIDIFPIFLK